MKLYAAITHCLREYPLITIIGVFGTLHTAGDFIARQIYQQDDYVFGDATRQMLDSAEKSMLEFGDLGAATLRRLFGHDARHTAAFEEARARRGSCSSARTEEAPRRSSRPFFGKRPSCCSGASTASS